MSKSIKVSSIVKRVNMDKSILGSDEISALYGSGFAPLVFKDEVKMIVPGNVLGGPIKLQANILTKERLQSIRSQKFRGKSCAYLHLGVVPIVIQSLLVSGNEKVRGRCSLVDLSRSSESSGLIDRFTFKFSKNEPFAAKILTINAPVDIQCDASVNSIQILLELEGIDIRSERSVIAIITGLSCVPTNSTVMLPGLKRETPKWPICNVFSVPEDSEEENERFEGLFKSANPSLIESGKDMVLDEGKRFGFWGPVIKPVHRRELSTKNVIQEKLSQVMSETDQHLKKEGKAILTDSLLKRTFSSRDVSKIGKEEVHPRRSFGVDMGKLHRSSKCNWGLEDECTRGNCTNDSTGVCTEDDDNVKQAEDDIWKHCRLFGGPNDKLSVRYGNVRDYECGGSGQCASNRWEFQSKNSCGESEEFHKHKPRSEDIRLNIEGSMQEFCKLRP